MAFIKFACQSNGEVCSISLKKERKEEISDLENDFLNYLSRVIVPYMESLIFLCMYSVFYFLENILHSSSLNLAILNENRYGLWSLEASSILVTYKNSAWERRAVTGLSSLNAEHWGPWTLGALTAGPFLHSFTLTIISSGVVQWAALPSSVQMLEDRTGTLVPTDG